MQKELIALFGRISVPGDKTAEARHLKEAQAINLEASVEGYALSAGVIDALARSSKDDIDWFRRTLNSVLPAITGSNVNHRALFNKFPYETPDQREYFTRRVIGRMQNATGQTGVTFRPLSCGHMIDSRLFGDGSSFGACPICQFQVEELPGREEVRHDFKAVTPFKVLELADERFVRDQAYGLIARNSSMSLDERKFVRMVIDLGIFKNWNRPVPDAIYRENLPFAYLLANRDAEYMRPFIKGATDILRIAAYLSDSEADLSLKEKPKFKLKTGDRKVLLDLLNGLSNLPEDMLRHREAWLRFDKHVGFGTAKNKERFPAVWEALRVLREEPGSVPTFNRVIEKSVRGRKVDEAFLKKLGERPGVFMRTLDFILRETTVAEDSKTFAFLADVASKATTESLIGVWKYLQFRGTYASERLFLPKGMVNKMQVKQDTRRTIKRDRLNAARSVLEGEILSRFASLPPLGRVHVDQELTAHVVPFNRRGDSSSTVALQKGSSYPLEQGEVIRLFVWWKGDIDVDLSAAFYDENYNLVEQCSFTNTTVRGLNVVHSGDIQNAPNGASEFIDFEPARLAAKGIRYVFPNLISFRSEDFSSFPCFAGYMTRDSMKSGKKFEPHAVEFKFDVNGPTTSHMPFAFDLQSCRLLYLDLAGGRGRHQTVSRSNKLLANTLRVAQTLVDRKPTFFDVVSLHVKARGELVASPDGADRVITMNTLKGIDLLNPEQMEDIGGATPAVAPVGPAETDERYDPFAIRR